MVGVVLVVESEGVREAVVKVRGEERDERLRGVRSVWQSNLGVWAVLLCCCEGVGVGEVVVDVMVWLVGVVGSEGVREAVVKVRRVGGRGRVRE